MFEETGWIANERREENTSTKRGMMGLINDERHKKDWSGAGCTYDATQYSYRLYQ